MGSQVLPANLLQCVLLSPWVHRSCQEPALCGLPTGSQPPSGASTCSSVGVLHRLQGDSLPHHGLHHKLQGNVSSSTWSTSSPSFFTDLAFSDEKRERDTKSDKKDGNRQPMGEKKRENATLVALVSLTKLTATHSTEGPGKIMEKIILGAIERHLKDNAIIRHSQHGFTKGKSCLTNLISFYDKVTCLADEGKAVDVVSLDFSKAFCGRMVK
ncbi:hypothetical protein QYF61_019761 [Mycteria americana]|uniref:Rna-directed dna polymerase from mobile element jockey-like n=1 Tax=Mycteria americana TaxID=33587 RepID=A0AAN7RPS2_MYCAM|nr:hypothetical protein QYF61_019761 [Mycteria americana]